MRITIKAQDGRVVQDLVLPFVTDTGRTGGAVSIGAKTDGETFTATVALTDGELDLMDRAVDAEYFPRGKPISRWDAMSVGDQEALQMMGSPEAVARAKAEPWDVMSREQRQKLMDHLQAPLEPEFGASQVGSRNHEAAENRPFNPSRVVTARKELEKALAARLPASDRIATAIEGMIRAFVAEEIEKIGAPGAWHRGGA